MKLYTAIFTKEDVGYSVNIPAVENCFTEGDTKEEAYLNAKEVLSLMIETYQEIDPSYKLPDDIAEGDYKLKDGDFTQLVEFQPAQRKSVKKTLTIPFWMNEIVKQHKINCSQLLQDAILNKVKNQQYINK
jgi:predicted RNase H-like HicB family nuclease